MADLNSSLRVRTPPAGVDSEITVAELLALFSVPSPNTTTGLIINQANQVISTPADGSTVTLDLSVASTFKPAALGGNRQLALSHAPTSSPWVRPFTLILTQGSGSQIPLWWSGIKWAGGSPPTLSTAAGAIDMFIFLQIGAASYLGQVVGQGYA